MNSQTTPGGLMDQRSGLARFAKRYLSSFPLSHWSQVIQGKFGYLADPRVILFPRYNFSRNLITRDQGPGVVWGRLPLSSLARWSQVYQRNHGFLSGINRPETSSGLS